MGFVFFDTETTGLRRGFDQIVHFAAIHTDGELNELDRREFRSRLQPHIVPHPSALIATGLSIEQLIDRSLPSHYEMMTQVVATLQEWTPAIFVGYNSIRFDEEMLRHALFQTLYNPFLTSLNNNCRSDIFSLALAASTFELGCLVIPMLEGGGQSFKLEHLAPANGVEHNSAHNALSDVATTLELSRVIRDRAPEVWNRFVRFSKKATVSTFAQEEDGFLLTEYYGHQAYHAPVVYLGPDPNPVQSNVLLCLNLTNDIDMLTTLSDEALAEFISQKPSPVRRVRTNAGPTITPLMDLPDNFQDLIAIERAEEAARRVKNDPHLIARIIQAYSRSQKPWPPSEIVEERLYESFPGDQDNVRRINFHEAGWQERARIIETFDDERLRIIGRRIVYFQRRSLLPDHVVLDIESTLTDRLVRCSGENWLTLGAALEALESLGPANSPSEVAIRASYRAHLRERLERVTTFRASKFDVGAC